MLPAFGRCSSIFVGSMVFLFYFFFFSIIFVCFFFYIYFFSLDSPKASRQTSTRKLLERNLWLFKSKEIQCLFKKNEPNDTKRNETKWKKGKQLSPKQISRFMFTFSASSPSIILFISPLSVCFYFYFYYSHVSQGCLAFVKWLSIFRYAKFFKLVLNF